MYALNATLAIDGKAMYFGGWKGAPDAGLRPSKAWNSKPRISRVHTD